jgi:hypothetical protein
MRHAFLPCPISHGGMAKHHSRRQCMKGRELAVVCKWFQGRDEQTAASHQAAITK